MTVIDWLLDSDPSLRWQVLRDLAAARRSHYPRHPRPPLRLEGEGRRQ